MLPTISTLNQYITLEIIPKTPDSPIFFPNHLGFWE